MRVPYRIGRIQKLDVAKTLRHGVSSLMRLACATEA